MTASTGRDAAAGHVGEGWWPPLNLQIVACDGFAGFGFRVSSLRIGAEAPMRRLETLNPNPAHPSINLCCPKP